MKIPKFRPSYTRESETARLDAAPEREKVIPALSVMIAAYTITRMLDMLAREGTKTIVKVVASIAIVVTLVAVIGILGAGSKMGNSLPY